jgi:predicted lipoprotein with Yx(FWY)xxD motif
MLHKSTAATTALTDLSGSARRWMRLAIVGAIALAVLTIGAAQHSARAESSSPMLIAANSQLGQSIFTDQNGITLYTFSKDTAGSGQSACVGPCVAAWPAFHAPAGDLELPYGASGAIGTITGTDGSLQVTYNGMPLYYFAGDASPGDVKGQGIGGVWFAAQP